MSENDGKGYGCFVMFVAGVALVFSLISLHKWDNYGVFNMCGNDLIVTGLSTLVTFLVAWQIWQTIDAKDTINRLKGETHDLRQTVQSERVSNKHLVRAYHTLASVLDIKRDKIETKLSSSGYIETAYAMLGFLLAGLRSDSYEVEKCLLDFELYIKTLQDKKPTEAINSFKNDDKEIDEIHDRLVSHIENNMKNEVELTRKLKAFKTDRKEVIRKKIYSPVSVQ